MVEIPIVQVVKKNAADAARLVAVTEYEIVVAPALEARIAAAEGRQRVAAAAMEMNGVLFVAVIRRQVHAATEPPGRLALRPGRDEQPQIHVHGGRMRIGRV